MCVTPSTLQVFLLTRNQSVFIIFSFFFFQVMSFSYNMASFQPFLSVLSDSPAFWRGNRFIGLLGVFSCFVILFLIDLVY